VAVIDTEHRSASKYIGNRPAGNGQPWQFDVCELEHYSPSTYAQVVREAGRAGYDVIVIDSLSHAWEGVGGALDQVDKKGGNSFTAWKDVTPQHRDMIEAILSSPAHIVATMRSKMEYVLEEQVNKSGKTIQVPKKVGMAPIQRQGMEYEFDLICDLTIDHLLTVSKSRCPTMDGKTASMPGPAFVEPFRQWLDEGENEQSQSPQQQTVPAFQQTVPSSSPDWKHPGPGAVYAIRDTDPCTADQQQQIRQLAEQLGMSEDDVRAALAKRKAAKIADLKYAAAQDLIGKMTGWTKISENAQEPDCPFQ
jgi:hypothetical protein